MRDWCVQDGPPDDESLGTGDVSSGTEESTDDDFDEVEGGLTDNQARLLYMFSLYTHPAETEEEDERWMRKQAAMVLLYEGVRRRSRRNAALQRSRSSRSSAFCSADRPGGALTIAVAGCAGGGEGVRLRLCTVERAGGGAAHVL